MKKILAIIIATCLCLAFAGCEFGMTNNCAHEIACDDTSVYAVVNGKLYGRCSLCGSYAVLSDEQISALDGKMLVKQGGGYVVTDKTIAELTGEAKYGSTVNIYLMKGDNYIIDSGKPQVRTSPADAVNVNITGLKDSEGNLLSSVQLDNPSDKETHSRYMSHLNLNIKNVILVGEDHDANGDERHGAGFLDVNNLVVENCIFKKSQCLWNYGSEYTIKNCTFVEPFDKSKTSAAYQMWTRGSGTWNFVDCKFISHGKALKIYSSTGTVNVTGCTFEIDQKVQNDKFAIEIDASLTVNVTDCTQTGYKGLRK